MQKHVKNIVLPKNCNILGLHSYHAWNQKCLWVFRFLILTQLSKDNEGESILKEAIAVTYMQMYKYSLISLLIIFILKYSYITPSFSYLQPQHREATYNKSVVNIILKGENPSEI